MFTILSCALLIAMFAGIASSSIHVGLKLSLRRLSFRFYCP